MAGDIQSGIQRLNAFRKKAPAARKRALKEMRRQGRLEHNLMWQRFNNERYADETGQVRGLGQISAAWRKRSSKRRASAISGVTSGAPVLVGWRVSEDEPEVVVTSPGQRGRTKAPLPFLASADHSRFQPASRISPSRVGRPGRLSDSG